jgi:hypothetical protein
MSRVGLSLNLKPTEAGQEVDNENRLLVRGRLLRQSNSATSEAPAFQLPQVLSLCLIQIVNVGIGDQWKSS